MKARSFSVRQALASGSLSPFSRMFEKVRPASSGSRLTDIVRNTRSMRPRISGVPAIVRRTSTPRSAHAVWNTRDLKAEPQSVAIFSGSPCICQRP